MQHLRSGRRLRRAIKTDTHGEQRGKIADAVSIRERPADVEDRAVPGHWEGDLLSGSKNSHIVTLVERQSRFTSLIKVPNKETATVVAALTRQIRKLPAALRRSLTWDRGHESFSHVLTRGHQGLCAASTKRIMRLANVRESSVRAVPAVFASRRA